MDLRLAVGCTDLERAGPRQKGAPPLDGALEFLGAREKREGARKKLPGRGVRRMACSLAGGPDPHGVRDCGLLADGQASKRI